MSGIEAGGAAAPLRKLGFWSVWAIGVGSVVGDGIFKLLAVGIREAGPSAVLAFLVAGLFQAFLMVALGELAVGMPSAGAMSEWVRRLLGDGWGFLAGFAFAVGWVFAGGSVGIAIGEFTCLFFAPTSDPVRTAAFAIGFLTLFAALNVVGVEIAARTQLILVLVLVGLVAVFAVVGAFQVDPGNFRPFMPNGWSGFWAAVPLGTYAYLGAVTLATAGGECKDPRDLPRALVWSSVTFLILYTAAQAVLQGIIPAAEIDPDAPFTPAAERVFGPTGWLVATLAAWLAAATTLLMGTLYAAPRILYAQATAGQLPRWLGIVHPRTRTPVPAILAVWAASVGLVLVYVFGVFGPEFKYYDFYSLQLVFAWMVSWFLTLVAAVLYRRRFPAEVRALPWRQPLYPLFPALGLIGIVVVTYQTFKSDPLTLAVGGGWMALAVGYYLLFARRPGRTPLV